MIKTWQRFDIIPSLGIDRQLVDCGMIIPLARLIPPRQATKVVGVHGNQLAIPPPVKQSDPIAK
jgi:hypothetical protein